jgi:hypothetical protein
MLSSCKNTTNSLWIVFASMRLTALILAAAGQK